MQSVGKNWVSFRWEIKKGHARWIILLRCLPRPRKAPRRSRVGFQARRVIIPGRRNVSFVPTEKGPHRYPEPSNNRTNDNTWGMSDERLIWILIQTIRVERIGFQTATRRARRLGESTYLENIIVSWSYSCRSGERKFKDFMKRKVSLGIVHKSRTRALKVVWISWNWLNS